ncbi:hypothetical protein EXIGLDRAFT_499156 [Exidia glandulosa HHB12029]|uniref:Uncharacterized protein n=1 Tax=Exidia glandulosa HHB12029 TaxID=1314781 RepID=A0A165JGE5_EXIGL|nr:hypothetical protein EXIGLDRAFT_499156 [Exidia glandulosa HHB12029]
MSFAQKPPLSTNVSASKISLPSVTLPRPVPVAQLKANLRYKFSRIPILRTVVKPAVYTYQRCTRPSIIKRQDSSDSRKSVRFTEDTKTFDAVDDPSLDLDQPRGDRKLPGFPVPGTRDFESAQISGRYESCYSSVNRRVKLARSASASAIPLTVQRPATVRSSSHPSPSSRSACYAEIQSSNTRPSTASTVYFPDVPTQAEPEEMPSPGCYQLPRDEARTMSRALVPISPAAYIAWAQRAAVISYAHALFMQQQQQQALC